MAVTLVADRTPAFASCHFTTQRNVALLHKSHPLAAAESVTVAELAGDSFAIFNQENICQGGFHPKDEIPPINWKLSA